MSVSPDEFRAVLGRFPSGVTVVTTKAADGTDQGMTVSAFSSLSLDPPLVLICIEKSASVHDALTTASGFIVNVLSAKQEQIARRFAIVDIDRFEGVGFRYPAGGDAAGGGAGADKWALRNVDVFVPKGQSLALVGENGAGKTTFIKLLAGLYDPTEGRGYAQLER